MARDNDSDYYGSSDEEDAIQLDSEYDEQPVKTRTALISPARRRSTASRVKTKRTTTNKVPEIAKYVEIETKGGLPLIKGQFRVMGTATDSADETGDAEEKCKHE